MKRISSLLLLMLIPVGLLLAQDTINKQPQNPYHKKAKKPVTDKFYFGGTLGFTFGSYTSISIWPLAGYKLTPKLSLGLQPGYEYIKDNYYDYETSSYGARLFTRYRIIPAIYLHAEYAMINYEIYDWNNNNDLITTRDWVPFLFLGGGVSQQIGGQGWVYAQILFDVLNDPHSPYAAGTPFYSIGIGVGF